MKNRESFSGTFSSLCTLLYVRKYCQSIVMCNIMYVGTYNGSFFPNFLKFNPVKVILCRLQKMVLYDMWLIVY